MRAEWRLIALAAASAAALVWMVPFAWMALATLRPGVPADIASLTPAGPFGLRNFQEAWHSGSFPLWYLNTLIVCGGILAVQLVTVTAAGYAFARLTFPGRDVLFALFLLQLLLVFYDRLLGIMAPYFASAFGTFLMHQTFRTIPRDYEEAAMLEGATVPALIRHVLVPLARPGLAAFAIVSVTAHWNEFLWPLMAVSSPSSQVLTVGLASFASGAEAGSAWGIVAAGTFLVAGPLLLLFLIFQRRFVASFIFSGIK